MSPIDFPDLLSESRGRQKSGRGLVATLRSRSRSRSEARAQRRAVSANPRDRDRARELEEEKAEKKKRRSMSRPSSSRHPKEVITKPVKEEKKVTKVEAVEESAKEHRRHREARTLSPAKRRSTVKSSNQEQSAHKKEWSADIINLVDRNEEEEDDDLLGEILSGRNPVITIKAKKADKQIEHKISKRSKSLTRSSDKKEAQASSSKKKDKHSATSAGSPRGVDRFPSPKARKHSDEEPEYSDTEDDEEEEEEANSIATSDLLDQVKARMEQQRLMEEAKELRRTIEKKDAEIDQLTGQLRMAISTKCDLVIAHTELERLHEMDLKHRDQYAEEMKRSNLALLEVRAEVEKEFMNEINQLAKQVEESEEKRVQEATEKDDIIRLMEEKIRRLELSVIGGASARRDNDKVKYYKQKLGVYDEYYQ